MNNFDKKLYKSLNYFASHRLTYIIKAQKSNKREFRNNLHKDVKDYAFDEGYLDADKRNLYGITPKGLDQLRTLEGIVHNQKTFWVSITAIVLSIISIILSIYMSGGIN